MRGYTLLSCMISAALLSALTALLVTDARNNVRAFIRMHEAVRENARRVQARELIDGIAGDIDSHRFAIFPEIHRHGRITWADNTVNTLASSGSLNAPDSSSDAITAFACESNRLLRVINVDRDGNSFRFFTRALYVQAPAFEEDMAFIGVGADSFIYLRGTLHKAPQDGRMEAVLGQTKNMILPEGSHDEPLGVRVIIPIEREYTIYLSKKGELRYAGHRGGENIENQPLFGPVEKLTLDRRETFAGGITTIEAVFTFPMKRTFAYATVHHLSRVSHLNLVLS